MTYPHQRMESQTQTCSSHQCRGNFSLSGISKLEQNGYLMHPRSFLLAANFMARLFRRWYNTRFHEFDFREWFQHVSTTTQFTSEVSYLIGMNLFLDHASISASPLRILPEGQEISFADQPENVLSPEQEFLWELLGPPWGKKTAWAHSFCSSWIKIGMTCTVICEEKTLCRLLHLAAIVTFLPLWQARF